MGCATSKQSRRDLRPCSFLMPQHRHSSRGTQDAEPLLESKLGSKRSSGAASPNATWTEISDFRKCPPSGEGKVVLYFTSLSGVRKTCEECFWVRTILRGYEVRVDERDVSMDRRLRDELTEILGTESEGSRLPRVFANGRDLGGAEEVKRMHEAGELGEALRDCEEAFVGEKRWGRRCEECGGVRFVLCGHCSGSCKVYFEEEEEWGDVVEKGFRSCPGCNGNGIVRCSACC